MLHERSRPAERGRSQPLGAPADDSRHGDNQREQITFESSRLHFTGLADIVVVPRKPPRWSLVLKRGFDVAASLVGLIVTAPLLGALSVLICLESSGPPLFRHRRVGLRGRQFGCLKLRTMRPDAERRLRIDAALYDEYRRHHFKIPDDRDPRTTRIGRWLRRTSLDELPQLWNVLVGDMSLVGPRPVVEEELAVYQGSRTTLLSMRPGITGAWAVGGRQCVGYPERCDLELRYVREWKPSLDAKILIATFGAVLAPERHKRRLETTRRERRAIVAPAKIAGVATPTDLSESTSAGSLPTQPLSAP
jgi:exopolysaccharide production protein ExoY